MTWKIVLLQGNESAKTFQVNQDQPLMIGRGTASDTQINDPKLSRIHCKVFIDGGRIFVEDAGSTAGTYVRGKRVERQVIDIDDEIVIGDTRLRLANDNPLDIKTNAGTLSAKSASSGSKFTGRLDELVGRTINRFELQHLVARGKTGVVFKAIDTADGKPIAFKILHPQNTIDETQRERFIRAMRTMLPIRHPHIVRLYRAGKQSNLCWVAMEWVSGSSLHEIIDLIGIQGTLDWKDIWRIAVHIGRALTEAEKRMIVHRNVTPTNIIRRDQDKSYLLTDLVFAKALEETETAQLTRPGDIVGELPYLAPERIYDPQSLSGQSDRYSLGVTLYVLATGKLPFAATNIVTLLEQIGNQKPIAPAVASIGFDERFSDLVMKLISREPRDRFASSIEFLKELERVGKFGGLEADWTEWV